MLRRVRVPEPALNRPLGRLEKKMQSILPSLFSSEIPDTTRLSMKISPYQMLKESAAGPAGMLLLLALPLHIPNAISLRRENTKVKKNVATCRRPRRGGTMGYRPVVCSSWPVHRRRIMDAFLYRYPCGMLPFILHGPRSEN